MELIEYTFDALLAEKYADLCASLYRDDVQWSPLLKQRLLRQFAPEHDFYRHSGNAHCHILAMHDDRPVGHISAMVNSDLQARYGKDLGIIGFFECIEDSVLAAELLHAARQWLHSTYAISRIIGPMNFDIWHGYRLMTKGFHAPVFFGEPHNKDYYPGYFERNGYSVCKRWTSILVEGPDALQRLVDPWAQCYQDAMTDGYCFVRIDPHDKKQIETLQQAIESSFSRFAYFNTLDFCEFQRVFGAFIESLDPSFVTLVWDREKRIAGFAIAFSQQVPAARAILFMLGITAEEAARHKGVGRAAFYHCLQALIQVGSRSLLIALTAEDSPVRRLLGEHVDFAEKEYDLYETLL